MVIKLLQWNIWYKENIDNIIQELKRIDADIVCIQELSIFKDDYTNINKLCNVYQYMYYQVADTFDDERSQCNAILSKYPLKANMHEFVQNPSENKNDYSKEGRIYIEAKVKIGKGSLNVGTTHLSYTDRFSETDLKNEEVKKLINIISKHKRNFVFVGDLNSNKDSSYIKRISNNLKYYETGNTWPTKPFSYNGFIETELNWKLDYVFSTHDVLLKDIKVVETKYSDHLPILIEIKMI